MEFALEKEALLFDKDFNPKNYEKNDLSDNITLDFGDNQIEVISTVHDNEFLLVEEMLGFLNSEKLIKYNTWPLSQPGILDYDVKYSALGEESYKYRQYLDEKYGLDVMKLSGIHLNISMEEVKDNKTIYYFNLMKKLYEFIPLILQFVAYTPFYEKDSFSFDLKDIGKNSGLENSISLRNSYKYGYMNYNKLNLNYDTYEKYVESIANLIKHKVIESTKEMYTPIRLKGEGNSTYLELRFIDLNPYYIVGINVDVLTIIKLMIGFIKELDDKNIDVYRGLENFERVALDGQNKEEIYNILGKEDSLENHTIFLLEEILKKDISERERFLVEEYLKKYKKNNLDFNRFCKEIKRDNLSIREFGIKHSFVKETFEQLYPDKSMELSTKILMKEAQEQGYEIDIISEEFNLVNFQKGPVNESIMQATKTNLDGLMTYFILENKLLTKRYLEKANINTPEGFTKKKSLYEKEKFTLNNFELNFLKEHKIVIKPFDTNYGLGITILQKGSTEEAILKAFEFAFSYSDLVLCEKFVDGIEYRFLVIGCEVVSIIKRIPANVKGDGRHTILELIGFKNEDALRNKGHVTPLEKLELGVVEKDYLITQGLTENSILEEDKIVFLRENSNISTGGDSYECFDLHSEYYKEIAIKASSLMDAQICGIDMIIDKDFKTYSIIEANFNPAIQIHSYPYFGIGKNVARKILELVENKQT